MLPDIITCATAFQESSQIKKTEKLRNLGILRFTLCMLCIYIICVFFLFYHYFTAIECCNFSFKEYTKYMSLFLFYWGRKKNKYVFNNSVKFTNFLTVFSGSHSMCFPNISQGMILTYSGYASSNKVIKKNKV